MEKNIVLLFRLLAQAFSYPEESLFRQMHETFSLIDLETLQNPQCPLPQFIQALSNLPAYPLEQVQAEYTRLFISGYPHLPCPPYESAYREGVLLGHAAESADRFYRRWGVVVDGEQVDHIAVELEFMVYLYNLDTPPALQAAGEFLAEHLLTWLPRFAQDMVNAGSMTFYQEAGRLLAAVLARQKKTLAASPSPSTLAQEDLPVEHTYAL